MKKTVQVTIFILVIAGIGWCFSKAKQWQFVERDGAGGITLPKPALSGSVSVEKALSGRRSVRNYRDTPITIGELSQLLWAAQGVTSRYGYRTAPSAGALYPLEVYVAAGNVVKLAPGIYRYVPEKHSLERVTSGDVRRELADASLGQSPVSDGAAVIVIGAVYSRSMIKYRNRGRRYSVMESGHAAQNVYLQCESLGLGTVLIGAFDGEGVRRALELPEKVDPLCVMPIGRK